MTEDPATSTQAAGPARSGEKGTAPVQKSFFGVFFSIMLPMYLAVVDQTIIATALPSIAGSLGGIDRLSWVVVAYLVAATVAAPVYGQLGDLLGRRRLVIVALSIFMAASLLCALSTSIEMLTAMRVLQGLGGGGLATLSQALIGEVVAPRERAHYHGYLAAVAVTSSTSGPVFGGFLSQHLGWQSVFLINLPLGALAILLALRLPKRGGTGARFRFDFPGALLFASFVASALVLVQHLQKLEISLLPQVLGLAVLMTVALVLLVWRENSIEEPLLPVGLLRNPTIWRSDALAACHGATLVSLLTFLPIYLHVVKGVSSSEAGLLLLPMTIGVGLGAMMTGRMVSRTGKTAVFPSIGLIFVATGLISMSLAIDRLSFVQLACLLSLIALGMGTVMSVVQVMIQSTAGAAKLGAAAATVQFSRALGAAFGTAAVGAVLFTVLASHAPVAAGAFSAILQGDSASLEGLSEATRAVAEGGIVIAFRAAFLTIAGFAVTGSVLAWLIPQRRI